MRIPVLVVTTVALLSLGASAKTQSVSECLNKPDTVGCLVLSAYQRIEQLPAGESKVERYAGLLTAMVSAKHQNDEVFRASKVARDGSSSAIQTWSLLLARQNYAVSYGVPIDDRSELELLLVLTEPTRKIAGDKITTMVGQACESYRTVPKSSFQPWIAFLENQCSLSSKELQASETENLGVARLAFPLVLGYRGNQEGTREAVSLSRETLAYFQSMRDQLKPEGKTGDNLEKLIFAGYVINATALAVSKQPDLARADLEIALGGLRKNKRLMNDPEFVASASYVTWVMVELGQDREALRQIAKTMTLVDRKGFMSVKEQVDAIVGCLEAVQMMRAK